jgi:fucose permease
VGTWQSLGNVLIPHLTTLLKGPNSFAQIIFIFAMLSFLVGWTSRVVFPWLHDRQSISLTTIALIGSIIFAASLSLIPLLDTHPTRFWLLLLFAIFGLGMGHGVASPVSPSILSHSQQGKIISYGQGFEFLGRITVPIILAWLMELGVWYPWIISSVLILFAAVALACTSCQESIALE